MQLYSFGRFGRFVALLLVPIAAFSMGGCPPQGSGGNGAVCGNGTIETGEECDDGNTAANDGCSADCQTEAGGECGDGTIDSGEQCDDGNAASGDGCSATCQDEEPNPPAPADSDGDGVRDDVDECPDTSRGTQVNDAGCPEAAPVDDPDGDGVAGAADDCPNTPTGAEVDADGCAANQRDTDGDGVTDNRDACKNSADGAEVDDDGCAIGDPDAADADDDGVGDDVDLCADTPDGAEVDREGCAADQRDTDDDGVNDDEDACPTQAGTGADGCPTGGGGGGGGGNPPVCGNRSVESGEQCDDGNTTSGDGCSATCQTELGGPRCGNGILENGEQCDDSNTAGGDCCSPSCQFATGGIAGDCCNAPTAIGEGTLLYSNVGANTDGKAEPLDCVFFGRGDIPSDIWYCYTATCTGPVTVSLCGSSYDTKLAVYNGCSCPSAPTDRPLECSDDDCGMGIQNTQSRVVVDVTAGQRYMVRIGGFAGDQGEGRLTIRCGGDDGCTGATGDCMSAHADDEPGCETPSCCERVCGVDQFCCDVTWDSFCASEASGYCTTGFSTCNSRAGGCDAAHDGAGCNDEDCCNAVCEVDPFCCITGWDANCANRAGVICAACGRSAGDCFAAHAGRGCGDVSCCARVCIDDEFCCDTEWDDTCAAAADDLCR